MKRYKDSSGGQMGFSQNGTSFLFVTPFFGVCVAVGLFSVIIHQTTKNTGRWLTKR